MTPTVKELMERSPRFRDAYLNPPPLKVRKPPEKGAAPVLGPLEVSQRVVEGVEANPESLRVVVKGVTGEMIMERARVVRSEWEQQVKNANSANGSGGIGAAHVYHPFDGLRGQADE
jgi:hypothetical protein